MVAPFVVAYGFQISKRIGISVLMLLVLVGALAGCRSDRVAIDPKDPDAPKFAYRLDELALLQMAADDIQELERNKQYGTIYDNFASDGFKAGVNRRRFMIMSNCVETHLGGLLEFDRNDVGFRREFVKAGQGEQGLDVLNRDVQRVRGAIEEQLVFVSNGFNFKLNGLYWIAKDKQFLQCIQDSAQVTESPAPSEVSPGTMPEASNLPEDTPETASPGDETSKPDEASSASLKKDGEDSKPSTAVQEMKPLEERKKEPLQARPAGAGAVVDTRPAAPKPKKDAKSADGTSSKESGSGVPVPGSSKTPSSADSQHHQQDAPPTPGGADSSDASRL